MTSLACWDIGDGERKIASVLISLWVLWLNICTGFGGTKLKGAEGKQYIGLFLSKLKVIPLLDEFDWMKCSSSTHSTVVCLSWFKGPLHIDTSTLDFWRFQLTISYCSAAGGILYRKISFLSQEECTAPNILQKDLWKMQFPFSPSCLGGKELCGRSLVRRPEKREKFSVILRANCVGRDYGTSPLPPLSSRALQGGRGPV